MAIDLTSRSRHARGCGLRKWGKLTDAQKADLEAIQALTGEAKATIQRLLTCGAYRVELAAAQEILDRTYGRSEKIGSMSVHHTAETGSEAPRSDDEQEDMLCRALAAVRARKAEQAVVIDAEPAEGPAE